MINATKSFNMGQRRSCPSSLLEHCLGATVGACMAKISLGNGGLCANSVGFRWASSFLPYLCPLYVP